MVISSVVLYFFSPSSPPIFVYHLLRFSIFLLNPVLHPNFLGFLYFFFAKFFSQFSSIFCCGFLYFFVTQISTQFSCVIWCRVKHIHRFHGLILHWNLGRIQLKKIIVLKKGIYRNLRTEGKKVAVAKTKKTT